MTKSDRVYGKDPSLRAVLHQRSIGYVLAVARDHHVTTTVGKHGKQNTVALAAGLPARVWAQLSAGAGAKATASTTGR